MTPKERASIIADVLNPTLRSGKYDDGDEIRLEELIAWNILQAIAEERERCAKIADYAESVWEGETEQAIAIACRDIARVIREEYK